jgi:hypothetical protein
MIQSISVNRLSTLGRSLVAGSASLVAFARSRAHARHSETSRDDGRARRVSFAQGRGEGSRVALDVATGGGAREPRGRVRTRTARAISTGAIARTDSDKAAAGSA